MAITKQNDVLVLICLYQTAYPELVEGRGLHNVLEVLF